MLHGAWSGTRRRATLLTATKARFEIFRARQVVVKKNFVGIVAERQWQAVQAASALKATWSPGAGLPRQRDFYDHLRTAKPSRDAFAVNSKDVDQKLAAAAATLTATYRHPYQMHGSIGTSCAVADVGERNATIWSRAISVSDATERRCYLPARREPCA